MKIEKVVKPEQIIISKMEVLSVTELPAFIGPSFMEVASYIQKQGAKVLSAPFVSYIGLGMNGELKGGQVEVEVGFPIDKEVPSTDIMTCYVLPSYQAMSCFYQGAYENLTAPYQQLLAKIKAVSGKFLEKSYEYYISDNKTDSEYHETIIELPYK